MSPADAANEPQARSIEAKLQRRFLFDHLALSWVHLVACWYWRWGLTCLGLNADGPSMIAGEVRTSVR